MSRRLHRRNFVKSTGLLVGSAALARLPFAHANALAVAERPNVAVLDPNGAEITALKKGVEVMKARSKMNMADHTGWIGQARIHTDHCPHGNWFFLPWHRAYLYFFELICRAASGNPNFMLPYWDWTTQPTIPPVFWGGNGNPLDHQSNNPNFPGPHNGREIGPADAIPNEFVGPSVIQSILNNSSFRSSIGSDPAPVPRPNDGIDRAQSTLEGTPHNNVHGVINGDMGFPPTAARDPIFWLHHCNIDRIWTQWADKYPQGFPADTAYRNYNMSGFFDTSGNPASMTVEKTLNTFDLGYRYPQQLPPANALVGTHLTAVPLSRRIAVSVRAVATAAQPLQASITPHDALKNELVTASTAKEPPTIRLKISDFEQELPIGAFMRVFLNCDYLAPATPISDVHYVGSVCFFGDHGEGDAHAHGGSGFYLDVSRTVQALAQREQFDPTKLKVGMVVKARPQAKLPDEVLTLKPGAVEIAVVPPPHPA